jgi:cbb3-type cytochrome oxidase maturation protein
MTSLFIVIPLSLIIGIGILLLFLWAARKRQFEDIEGPKYRMLDDDDDDDEDDEPADGQH